MAAFIHLLDGAFLERARQVGEPVGVQLAPAEEAFIDQSGNPQDQDDTGVRSKNLSAEPGVVSVAFEPGPQQGRPVRVPGWTFAFGQYVKRLWESLGEWLRYPATVVQISHPQACES